MPRPVKDDPRDRFKSFRFTAGEITRLEARARAAGRTLSDYVRARIFDGHDHGPVAGHGVDGGALGPRRRASKKHPPDGSPSPPGIAGHDGFALRMLAEQMRKVGVNLNQIARRMNEQRSPPPRQLTVLLDEIRSYVRQARER